MTRLQLRTAVLANTNRSDKASVANTGLDLALEQLSLLHLWPEVEFESDVSLLTGAITVPLPALCHRLWAVVLLNGTNSQMVDLVDKRVFLDLFPDVAATSSGLPQYAYVSGTTLVLGPPSNDDYSLRLTCTKLLGPLVEDSDDNPLPGSDLFLIDWATAWVFRSVGMFEAAAQWLQASQSSARTLLEGHRQQNKVWISEGAAAFGRPQYTSGDPAHDPFVRRWP